MKNSIKFLKILILGLVFFSCQKDEKFDNQLFACNFPFADSSYQHPSDLKLNQLLNEITGSGVPGIVMSVQTENEGIWLGAAGKADLKSNIELKACNITRVGSTVKTFTASTIFILQEEGKLNLDDKITKYLSSSEIYDLANADQATIRQLLQHSSGIYNYIQNLKFQTASTNDLIKEWKPEELLSYARGQNAYFEAGTDVLYSNTNYILLGMIISNIEGKPFYDVFNEKIFVPLNLTSTSFAATNPVPENCIRGYVDFYSNLNLINATYYSGWDYYTADGGLISTAYDLNLFLTSLCEGKLISESSLNEMLGWQVPRQPDENFFPLAYGLGIFKMDTEWGEAYFHSGDAIGYYACMAYFPERKTTICWAVNGNYGKIDEFTSTKTAMEKIFRTVFE